MPTPSRHRSGSPLRLAFRMLRDPDLVTGAGPAPLPGCSAGADAGVRRALHVVLSLRVG